MKKIWNEKFTKEQKESIGVLIMIISLALFQIVRCINYPGAYMDAVMPDYLAVHLLFPQINNPTYTVAHVGFPLLGQLYHGTITVWLQLLIIGLTGKTSMLTLRLANMTYVVGICWFVYLICKRIGVNKAISIVGIAAMLLSPQIYSFVRTQYYIKLPGTLLLFSSLYCLLYIDGKKDKSGHPIVVSGILCGLAFYSYFIYLFFVPAMAILCAFQNRRYGQKRWIIIVNWLIGFCMGSVLYVIGYFDMLIARSSLDEGVKKTVVYIFGTALIFVCIFIYNYLAKNHCCTDKLVKLYMFIFASAVITVIVLMINFKYICSIIIPRLESLNIAQNKMNFVERLEAILTYWQDVMKNKYLEWFMLDTVTSVLPQIYMFSLEMLTIIMILIYIKTKSNDKIIKTIKIFFLMLLCYFLFSFVFIPRMGGQHFTPIFFITFMIQILELGYIKKNGHFHMVSELAVGIVAFLLIISVVNSNLLNTNMKMTGGKGKYSSQINQVAKEALDAKMSGKKEVYIFPEWGWRCGFSYLTMNQVDYMLSLDPNRLNGFLEQGYIFKLCGWDEVNMISYQNILNDMGIDEIAVEYRYSKDGNKDFYILYAYQ